MSDPFTIDDTSADVFHAGEMFTRNAERASPTSALSRLRNLGGKSNLERMKSLMTDSTYVIPMMIPTGSLSVIAAHPNSAKTLSIFALLIQQIKAGSLKGEDVFYINEDDNLKGLVTKTDIAYRYDMNMDSSIQTADEEIRNTSDILNLILLAAEEEDVSGKVFVFDTYKKFTAPMNVGQNTEFHKSLRRISSMGGTVILLHHANKHLTEDGKLVMKGTQDIMDDVDIVYFMYPRSEKDDETQIVEFVCEKDRGYVDQSFRFQYRKGLDVEYEEMLDSFQTVDDSDWARLEASNIRDKFLSDIGQHRETIRQILAANGGSMNWTQMWNFIQSKDEIDLPKAKLNTALDKLSAVGILKRDVGEFNSTIYSVNEMWTGGSYDWFKLPSNWR